MATEAATSVDKAAVWLDMVGTEELETEVAALAMASGTARLVWGMAGTQETTAWAVVAERPVVVKRVECQRRQNRPHQSRLLRSRLPRHLLLASPEVATAQAGAAALQVVSAGAPPVVVSWEEVRLVVLERLRGASPSRAPGTSGKSRRHRRFEESRGMSLL